ncbi:MAG: linear amide C-N hydrolase [Prevotellaceae bacterium]|nr:linear amide C-N hydrolase [Prevotellaceae bacterium]
MKNRVSIFLFALLLGCSTAMACSRVVFLGQDGLTLVGRTLDWRTPIPTNLYVYPRGMQKQGMPEGNTYHWKSKYGSVLAVSYDGGVTEGMNERGLVMNALFCKGSIYRTATNDKMHAMSLAVLVSYFLDNFETVDEVAAWLNKNEFAIYGQTFDEGTTAALHWAVTDRSGNTLIMEFQNGQLDVYVSRDYRVLTNDPPFPQMLAINNYWRQIGGANMLPGTVRSPDRFARASFFIEHVPTNVNYKEAAAEVLSVLNNVAVPLGYELEGSPNLSSTQWRSVADTKNLIYYFGLSYQFSVFNINLSMLNLNEGAPVLKMDTSQNTDLHGCINDVLVPSQPFKPMW